MKLNKKFIIILASVAAAAAAIGGGIWLFLNRSGSDPVYVYNFSMVGMTEFWGDGHESYGPVSTDKIQTVFLTDTQEVTKIKVKEGQDVKKGDLLMSFDTTLSDLQLERKRLEVEKLKLELEEAEQELIDIKNMRPMAAPSKPEEDPKAPKGTKLKGPYKISTNKDYDGSSKKLAMICWLAKGTTVNNDILEAVRAKAEDYQNDNALLEAKETAKKKKQKVKTPKHISVSSYYVVFKVTSDDMSRGSIETWQGMKVKKGSSGFSFVFFDASSNLDFTLKQMMQVEMPEIDFGSGYTAAEIAKMRQEQEQKIKDTEFSIRLAEAEFKIMEAEISDGNVYSEIDGKVVSVLTPDQAKAESQPIIKVSGGGGFYIEGSINELDRDQMVIGSPVTVVDWQNGGSYDGKVVYVGDLPKTGDYYDGNSNPNASYYTFRVFVDETANLQAGTFASIQYSANAENNGIYLENPFLRTENGRSYVYVMGENGRLEERTVTTGKYLWGSYTEILGGLSATDLVAFPYGKNVKPGAKAVEGDMSNLYG